MKRLSIIILSRKIYYAAAVFLIIMGSAALFWGVTDFFQTEETIASPLGNKVILIDPGHGGIDAGASANDAVEKELNLQISFLLKDYIEENGGICYMTRATDTNTADPQRSKGTSQKMSDLRTRKKNIDDFDADIFISIHMNKFSQSKYSGLQTFYDSSLPENKLLAESIQISVKSVLNDNNTRVAKPTGNSIYVLKGNSVPSALIECGFLSNPTEASNLKNPEYQKKVAWGIFLGIVNFFSY